MGINPFDWHYLECVWRTLCLLLDEQHIEWMNIYFAAANKCIDERREQSRKREGSYLVYSAAVQVPFL